MVKEKRHLYCLLTKSGDFEGLILTNVQQIIDYWHKITQCVFSWWHHWIVAIITIILLLNYLNPSFIWFSLCTFHLTRSKHQHNVLRDIISITTNTLHITPDSDSCHETRVEPHVTPTACCVTQLVTGTRVTCVLPGAAIFTRAPLSGPGCLRSNDAGSRHERHEIPATVGFETHKRAHARSLKLPILWTGNWK